MFKRITKSLRDYGQIARSNPHAVAREFTLAQIRQQQSTFQLNLWEHDLRLRSGTTDFRVAKSCFNGEFSALEEFCPASRSGLIIDAGGYIGTAAMTLADQYPRATVVTIEPSRENLAVLKENVRSYDNIFVEEGALLPSKGNGSVRLGNRGTGHYGFTTVEKPADRSIIASEQVPVRTIDEILENYGYDRIMIMKMDIEGAEHAFLSNSDWLAVTDVLMIELHDRIMPGCSEAFHSASKGRFVFKSSGEKYISVHADVVDQVDRVRRVQGKFYA